MVYIAAALLVVLWTVVVSAAPAPNVTITAWQYCEGCKLTVDIYAQVAAKKLKLLDKLPKGEEKVLDAAKVVENLCDNELFNSYGEFGKYSCIKVLEEEHRIKFLEEFAGSTTITSLLNKKGIFEKKQKVVYPGRVFRSRCSPCI
jgi:predicted DNA binding protein